MALKYLTDTAVLWSYTGRLWSPFDYANPVWFAREHALRGVPTSVLLALGLWALPFIWIGVGMSLRRAVDAGFSPWFALCFFVPYLNYLMMLGLALAPTSTGRTSWRDEPEPVLDDRWRSAILGLGAALAITLPTVLLSVYFKRQYSLGLFLGTPFTIGAIAAHIHNRRHPRSVGSTISVVVLAVLLAGAALLLLAAEGAICLVMAFPLAVLVAIVGGLLGRAIAVRGAEPLRRSGVAAMLAPLLILIEPPAPAPPRLVLTTVDIAAPPAVVWRQVVSFPDLPAPTEGIFRVGIAAPLRARIEGHGVGAVRSCDFTTGTFVEPITVWDEPRVLAFGITAQAPPMTEWSPYEDVHPPHLDGYFRATRGEFRLTPIPGGTRLEGRTWYEVRMGPNAYWSLYADRVVTAIHERVLEHIKRLSEQRK